MANQISKQQFLTLYKNILRCHRILQEPMKSMGDSYLRAEWRLHKNVDAKTSNIFYREWQGYLSFLLNQRQETMSNAVINDSNNNSTQQQQQDQIVPDITLNIGKDLDPKVLSAFNKQQLQQLEKLKQEAKNLSSS
eukprot:gene5606-6976_t